MTMAVTFWLKLQPLLYSRNIFITERQDNVLMHRESEVPAGLKMIFVYMLITTVSRYQFSYQVH